MGKGPNLHATVFPGVVNVHNVIHGWRAFSIVSVIKAAAMRGAIREYGKEA